jgi:hypothetical protein
MLRSDIAALVAAALVLIIVLVASYMCIQLYHLSTPNASAKDGFLGALYYTPACGSSWLGPRRRDCRGISSGKMPSIDTGPLATARCAGAPVVN